MMNAPKPRPVGSVTVEPPSFRHRIFKVFAREPQFLEMGPKLQLARA
jgi:hypothetical protein